jgi:heat shock protein HslJ
MSLRSSRRHSRAARPRTLTIAAIAVCAVAGCAISTSDGFRHPGESVAHSARVTAAHHDGFYEEAPTPIGHDWIFVKVEGYDGPLPSPPPVAGFIMTREGGRVTGTTACNALSAGYRLDEHTHYLRFESLRNRRMLCDRVASDTQEAVLAAMIATDGYRLAGNRLELLSEGRVVAVLLTND